MTENRDFLKEMEELRVETDGIRNALVSKTGHFQNLLSDSGILKEIMGELKEIRKEIKEGKEENEKKLEEIKIGMKKEIAEQIRQEMKVIDEKNEKKLDKIKLHLKKEIVEQKLLGLKNGIRQLTEKVDKSKEIPVVPGNDAEKIPIREAVIGEWKLVDYENFEGYRNIFFRALKKFSQNLKFELVDGKLKRSGGGHDEISEREGDGWKLLYVDGDHLKSFRTRNYIDEYYIENGKLHFVQNWYGQVWKRIYEKI